MTQGQLLQRLEAWIFMLPAGSDFGPMLDDLIDLALTDTLTESCVMEFEINVAIAFGA